MSVFPDTFRGREMRILLLHPNYHSGGAEIAGNWPPAWAAYIAGALKAAEFTDIRFIDAMTNDLSEEQLREIQRAEKPDVVGTTAITPSIYKAERLLQIAREIHPDALTVLGGIHATFMYQQVHGSAVGRCDRARGGRGDFRQPAARARGRALAGAAARHQGHRLPR